MRYAALFATASGAAAWSAFQGSSLGLWLLWPAASLGIVAAGYGGLGPKVFGKRLDGTLRIGNALVLAPYLTLTWLVWHTSRLLRREAPFNELAPGVVIGRRLLGSEYPPSAQIVVDLTAEFQEPAASRADRTYVGLPILDAHVPTADALMVTLGVLREASGEVYIHCAEGHGRTALVATALLIVKGKAMDVEEGALHVLRARPLAHMNRTQARFLSALMAEGVLG